MIGGGIAGASIGYELSDASKILLLEQEDAFGYHTTGRSAATYVELLHSQTIFALSRVSRDFLDNPPSGFTETPLLSSSGCILIGGESQRQQLKDAYNQATALGTEVEMLSASEVTKLVPIMRNGPDTLYAAIYEPQAKRIDVDRLLQGYLKGIKTQGSETLLRSEVEKIERSHNLWSIRTARGSFQSPVVVNAAGAWADRIAELAGIKTIGFTPKKRTMVTFDGPENLDISGWPMLGDVGSSFYFVPEAGQLMGSPADETPAPACDIQPDELDIATAVYNIEQHTNLQIKRINHSWAGLRTFAPDRLPVIGFDPGAEGFFWFAGQGGFGIQAAPAMAQLGKALALDLDPERRAVEMEIDPALLLPDRFRA